MNKTFRILIAIFIVIVLLTSTSIFVLASVNIPAATSDFYVNDFAKVFTTAEKEKLMSSAVSLANETDGIQVVVTTVESLEGETIENYAYNMYNEYGIGRNDKGLLILLATQDRQIRVEVGRGMEGYINDAKAGRFIDKYAIPYLKQNDFNLGLTNLQQAFIEEIKTCINSEQNKTDNNVQPVDIDWSAVLGVVLVIAIVGGTTFLVIFAVTKARKKARENKEYIESLNHEISRLTNAMEHAHTTQENLRREKRQISIDLQDSERKLDNLQSRYNRILTIYPDADKKVDEMIQAEKIARDKETASQVDNLISNVIHLQPARTLVSKLESIKSSYEYLNEQQRQYIVSDMARFNELYNSCCALKREYEEQVEMERRRQLTEDRKKKAASITKQLFGVISLVGIAGASDLSRLKDAKRLYENLDRETRSYVDSSAISKIEELLRRARRAKEEEEAEEARRRSTSYNSTSSYPRSSSTFGGFGGRSGGGGASRGF